MSGSITCLVRGGEAGRTVQEQAITFAAENNKRILFAHVIDITPLDNQDISTIKAMQSELEWLGNVILNMACRRAKLSGVSAEGVILYGTVLNAAIEHFSSHPTDAIFIGSPHPEIPDYPQKLERVYQFAGQLEEALDVSVKVAKDSNGLE